MQVLLHPLRNWSKSNRKSALFTTEKNSTHKVLFFGAVDRNRTCMSWGHKILSLARLPVPPRPHIIFSRPVYSTIFARLLQVLFLVFIKNFYGRALSGSNYLDCMHTKTDAPRTSVLVWCGQRDFKAALRVSSVLRLPPWSPWTTAYSNAHRAFSFTAVPFRVRIPSIVCILKQTPQGRLF